jgi:hypothetical protein
MSFDDGIEVCGIPDWLRAEQRFRVKFTGGKSSFEPGFRPEVTDAVARLPGVTLEFADDVLELIECRDRCSRDNTIAPVANETDNCIAHF